MSIEMSDVIEASTKTGTSPEQHRNNTPDTSTVKSLLTKQAALARHLDVSVKTVQLWVKMDRIPARHIIKIAQFYDVEVPLHLCQSDVKRGSERRIKPRETLPVCLEVQAGNLTIAEAAAKLGLHERAVQLILLHWGDQLPVLYKTLNDLDAGEITVAQAASTLGVCKNAVHDIRTKYGRAPVKSTAPSKRGERIARVDAKRQNVRNITVGAIAGRYTLEEVDAKFGVGWRTIHRQIAKLSPDYGMIKLTLWPKTLREAYANEIDKGLPLISRRLWEYSELAGLKLPKIAKYPVAPDNWRKATAREMLMHILLGTDTLASIAESRHADPAILEGIFTSTLRPLNLTWPEVVAGPAVTQLALGEVFMALEETKVTHRARVLARIAKEKRND